MERTNPENIIDEVERALGSTARGYFEGQRSAYLDDLRRLGELHRHGALLEVGGFPYFFSMCLSRSGWALQIFDLDPSRAEGRWRGHDLPVARCDIEREQWPCGQASITTVVMAAVFEHLRMDPLHALSEARRVLTPNGILYLTTPNFYRVGNILRIVTGKGPANNPVAEYRKLHTVGHMGHVREYCAAELRACLSASGFGKIEISYRNVGHSPHGALVDLTYACLRPMGRELVIVARP